jgi:hypothetical protein
MFFYFAFMSCLQVLRAEIRFASKLRYTQPRDLKMLHSLGLVCKTLVTLLCDGELDTLAAWKGDEWLLGTALTDDENVTDAGGELHEGARANRQCISMTRQFKEIP